MCDVPPKSRQVDSRVTGELRNAMPGNAQSYQISTKAPESHKRCISSILRNIALPQNGMMLPQTPILPSTFLREPLSKSYMDLANLRSSGP